MADKLYRPVTPPMALRHPLSGMHVVPDARTAYPADDPLVQAYPWAFQTDDDLAEEMRENPAPLERSVPVNPAKQTRGRRKTS